MEHNTIINTLKLINRFNSSKETEYSFSLDDPILGKYYHVLNDFVFKEECQSDFLIHESDQEVSAYGYGVMLSFCEEYINDAPSPYVTITKLDQVQDFAIPG